MTLVKTSELVGRALDYAVGLAQGWVVYPNDSIEHGEIWHLNSKCAPFGQVMRVEDFRPSTCWSQCGPLIEKYRVGIYCDYTPNETITANVTGSGSVATGETFLVAACRAIVAAYVGEDVEVPA